MDEPDDSGPTTSEAEAAAELRGTASTPPDKSDAAPAKAVAAPSDDVDVVTGSLSDFEKRAAEAEAEAGVEPEPAIPAKKEDAKAVETAKARDARLQKIIDSKFGGDEEKFVASLYEQQNSAAALHREMQELKKSLEKPEEPPTAEDHPDLGWISQETTSLKAEEVANREEQARLIAEGKELNAEILRKEGELKRADEFDAKELKREIAQIRSDINQKSLLWRNLDGRNRTIAKEQRDLARAKDVAEREVLGQREQLRNSEAQQRVEEAREYQKFEDSVNAVAKEFGIEAGEVYDDMYETARARAAMHIRVNGPVEDLSVLTRALCEKYTKVHGLNRKAEFEALSKEKAQSARPNGKVPPKAPETPPVAPRTSPEKKWTADFVRMRAAKILGG